MICRAACGRTASIAFQRHTPRGETMKTNQTSRRRGSRRRFLKTAAAVAAAPLFVPAALLGRDERTAPSERITMALIGCGGQGVGDMHGFMGFPDVQFVAV